MTAARRRLDRPDLVGAPVVLTHLADDHDPRLTACTGEPFTAPTAAGYPTVPRLLCPLCGHFARRGSIPADD